MQDKNVEMVTRSNLARSQKIFFTRSKVFQLFSQDLNVTQFQKTSALQCSVKYPFLLPSKAIHLFIVINIISFQNKTFSWYRTSRVWLSILARGSTRLDDDGFPTAARNEGGRVEEVHPDFHQKKEEDKEETRSRQARQGRRAWKRRGRVGQGLVAHDLS